MKSIFRLEAKKIYENCELIGIKILHNEEYLAEKMKIKVLGELKTIDEEVEPYMLVGERIVIDSSESDIVVWYADYCTWLERKFEELKNK